jgi:hypothetical protein
MCACAAAAARRTTNQPVHHPLPLERSLFPWDLYSQWWRVRTLPPANGWPWIVRESQGRCTLQVQGISLKQPLGTFKTLQVRGRPTGDPVQGSLLASLM